MDVPSAGPSEAGLAESSYQAIRVHSEDLRKVSAKRHFCCACHHTLWR